MEFHIHSGRLVRDMQRLERLRERDARTLDPLASWWREQSGIRGLDRLDI